MSNIEIVESLSSLYPLKDFEEEAIMEVVAEFRQLKEKATAKKTINHFEGTVEEYLQLKNKETEKKQNDNFEFSPCPRCGSRETLGDGFCYVCGTALD